METELIHFRHARRKRDERPNHRQKARDEDCDGAMFCKEPRHAIEIVMAHQDPAAVTFNKRTTAARADPIRDRRAHIAADGPSRGRPEKIQASQVTYVAGKGHDDFGGQRNARRFDAHESDNPGVAASRNHMSYELEQPGQKLLIHAPNQYIGPW